MILDINENLYTCQVKSTNSATDKLAEFMLTSSQAHRGGGRHTYDVDVFCCVDITNNKVFLVPNLETRSSIKIRYQPTENNQTKGINMWYDYTLEKFLK